MNISAALSARAPRALAVLRIVAALLFIEHGTQKLFGFPARQMPFELMSIVGLAAVLELVGGGLILIGLFTRPVAFVLCGEMAVAYFMAHAPQSVFPALNGGDASILFCFVFLYLVFAGAGGWSMDAALARRRTPNGA
jgi:putative oxidoreductase